MVHFIPEVSAVSSDTDELKMALRTQKGSGAFKKWATGVLLQVLNNITGFSQNLEGEGE